MDVFRTIAAVVPVTDPPTDPYVFQQQAADFSGGTCSFVAEFTTDQEGAPPTTHFLASGMIPEENVNQMAADPRFIVSEQKWTTFVTERNLTRVVPLE